MRHLSNIRRILSRFGQYGDASCLPRFSIARRSVLVKEITAQETSKVNPIGKKQSLDAVMKRRVCRLDARTAFYRIASALALARLE
jgi:hypothetical protein